MSYPLFKQEFYLKADNEQEIAQSGLLSFVDISRSGIQVLKRSATFKAIEFIGFQFPFSSNDRNWVKNVHTILKSDEFNVFVNHTETSFSVSNNKVTLIPASVYSEKEKTRSFQFLFGESNELLIQAHPLSNLDTVGVFEIPEGLVELVNKPVQSSYVNWLDDLLAISTKAKAHIVVCKGQFALFIQKDGQLIFSNWFEYSKSDDVLYYLMAVLETLKILHSEIEVILSGNVDKGDEIHSSVSKFISKLTFGKRHKNLTYSYSFRDLPEHRFPFIFSTSCA